jgi:GAF domain-containing protein
MPAGLSGDTMGDVEDIRGFAKLARELAPAFVPAGYDELLEAVVSAARRLFRAAACSIALLDDDGEHLVFRVADGTGAERITGSTIPSSEGIAGFVVRSGQSIVIEDTRTDPRFAGEFAGETGYAPSSILAVPLETEREILGVLEILDPASGTSGRDMEVVGLFAAQAALAIESSRAFERLGRTLLMAAATSAGEDTDLGRALAQASKETGDMDPAVAELGSLFAYLGQLGEDERKTATKLVADFVAYAQGARRMR